MALRYDTLLPSLDHRAEEKLHLYRTLTEKHLVLLWQKREYLGPLFTAQGEQIQVLSPGILNTESGPQFLKAHLRIGQRDLFGDVALHLHQENWTATSAHQKSLYNDVLLHASFWRPNNNAPVLTASGREPLTIHLENSLLCDIDHILRTFHIDELPYSSSTGNGKCAARLASALSQKELSALFQSAGLHRLLKKANRLKECGKNDPLKIALGIASALGSSHHQEAFESLALHLWPHREEPEEELLAQALGACGFFDQPSQKKWHTSPLYQNLSQKFESGSWIPKTCLIVHRIPPLSHPIRRIVYLVKLLQDKALLKLPEKLNCLKKPSTKLLPEYDDLYWNHHYTFESKTKSSKLPLLCKTVRQNWSMDGALPYLFHKCSDDSEKKELLSFYASLPTIHQEAHSELQGRFVGDEKGKELFDREITLQGAHQIADDFCSHYWVSCEGCPFISVFETP